MFIAPAYLSALITIALIIAALGLIVTKRSVWPKRTGPTPHCRNCDYLLVGGVSDRCPECGTQLDCRSIVHGERHRRPGRALLGAALLFSGLALIVTFSVGKLANVNWYPYKPFSWLLKDLESPNTAVVDPAWLEVHRRMN